MRRIVFFLTVMMVLPVLTNAQVMTSILPTPLLAQNDNPDEEIHKAKIKKNVLLNSGVKIVMNDFDFELDFYIIDFDVSVADGIYENTVSWKRAGTKPVKTYAKFNREQIEIMKKLKSGSRVTIENILVKGSDGKTRYLNPISLKVR